jgi:hypothetical protein
MPFAPPLSLGRRADFLVSRVIFPALWFAVNDGGDIYRAFMLSSARIEP